MMKGDSQLHVRMTIGRKNRLKLMAEAFGMPMSDFVKMVLDDKFIYMVENDVFTDHQLAELHISRVPEKT